jgi:methionyl aminopeptidase
MMTLYSQRQIGLIREAGKVVASSIALAKTMIKPGATTKQINDAVDAHIRSNGATPVFLGYELPNLPPFPGAICASVNDVVIHGLPDDRPLVEGDIVSIDVGAKKNDYIADGAWTFPVGEPSPTARLLLQVGEESLLKGLASASPIGYISDISKAVQSHVEGHGFSVVRDFCGHGVGHKLHEPPQVSNYVDEKTQQVRLKPGMVFAVEPMVNEGSFSVDWPKGQWIVKTKDSKLSVHFEHTIAITDGGIQVLTEE